MCRMSGPMIRPRLAAKTEVKDQRRDASHPLFPRPSPPPAHAHGVWSLAPRLAGGHRCRSVGLRDSCGDEVQGPGGPPGEIRSGGGDGGRDELLRSGWQGMRPCASRGLSPCRRLPRRHVRAFVSGSTGPVWLLRNAVAALAGAGGRSGFGHGGRHTGRAAEVGRAGSSGRVAGTTRRRAAHRTRIASGFGAARRRTGAG